MDNSEHYDAFISLLKSSVSNNDENVGILWSVPGLANWISVII